MNNIYQQRIVKAVQYIEENLSGDLNLADVASHCCFSAFHFHRIFSGVMKETLNSYISRRRLEKAVHWLAFKPEVNLTEIAYQCGFSSSANFSKATKQYFGYSPSEIRAPKDAQKVAVGNISKKYGKQFNPLALYPKAVKNNLHNDMTSMVKIQYFSAKRLCVLASLQGYQSASLFTTWDQLSAWAEAQDIAKQQQFRLAWCYDNPAVTPLDKCRYEASIAINDKITVSAPFKTALLPEGEYAVMYVKGSPEDINQMQLQLFSHWLPNSGYEPDNLPMLERYLNDVRIDQFIELELMLKLKRLK